MTKSLTVMDGRENKKINKFLSRGDYYQFHFPSDNPVEDIQNWFEKNNKNRKKGTKDIVVLLEKLEISNETKDNEIFCVLDLKVSTFLKENQHFNFLTRYDNVIKLSTKETGKIPNIYEENIGRVLQKVISDSYRMDPYNIPVDEDRLTDYENILKNTYEAFTSPQLKDGVYADSKDFFMQNPMKGYKIVHNDKDKIEALGENNKKLAQRKIFIYVENGTAYKNTYAGFLPLQKDDRGYFLLANRYILFPDEIEVSPVYYFFGAIGGIAAAIDMSAQYDKALKGEKFNIYLDFLTGEYSFAK